MLLSHSLRIGVRDLQCTHSVYIHAPIESGPVDIYEQGY